jgi:hypothetical protein
MVAVSFGIEQAIHRENDNCRERLQQWGNPGSPGSGTGAMGRCENRF